VTRKFISRSDPAAQWTGAHKGHAFFAYAANYLIDTDHGVIVDVEATRAIRQAEVGAARTMLERTETRFGVKPDSLTADSAYGSAESLAWLVKQKGIRRISPRCHRPKPETTRPLETDENASGNAGRMIPAGCLLLQNRRHRNQAHPCHRPED
jgi:Transposase DDE domain